MLLALLAGFALVDLRSAHAAAAPPIKLGAYVPNAPEDAGALDSYASMVGRKPAIVMKYSNVTDPLLTAAEIANLEARGETPMVSWQLYKSAWSGPTISLSDIGDGAYDSYLRHAADLARGLPFNVMIRFGHEMNGDWYGWSGHPSAYVDAWRHIVSVFRHEGAGNVKWVWSPNVDQGNYPFAKYFPGDSWVDYVALDGYNWGTRRRGSRSVAIAVSGLLLLLQDDHADEQQAGDHRRDLIQRCRWGQGGLDSAWLPEDDPGAIPTRPRGALVQPVDGGGLAGQFLRRFAPGVSHRSLQLALRRPRPGTDVREHERRGSGASGHSLESDRDARASRQGRLSTVPAGRGPDCGPSSARRRGQEGRQRDDSSLAAKRAHPALECGQRPPAPPWQLSSCGQGDRPRRSPVETQAGAIPGRLAGMLAFKRAVLKWLRSERRVPPRSQAPPAP